MLTIDVHCWPALNAGHTRKPSVTALKQQCKSVDFKQESIPVGCVQPACRSHPHVLQRGVAGLGSPSMWIRIPYPRRPVNRQTPVKTLLSRNYCCDIIMIYYMINVVDIFDIRICSSQ